MLRVLIADRLPDAARLHLQEAGLEVYADPALKGDALVEALRLHRPDVLVVRSTRVRVEHLEAADELALVVRAGAGVNTIDVEAASARGIYVANCPGRNAAAVAELAMGHLLQADRRIADAAADLRAGRWAKKEYGGARGLKGRRLAVLGTGTIGREVIRRALAFEMDVVAWSRSLTSERAGSLGVRRAPSALDAARGADALTVHLALTPATRGLVGEAVLAALRPGAIVVNTSRGGVVDEAALARAVEERGLRAALDVFEGEPAADGPWTHPILELPGVWGTPHIGASTAQAQEAVAEEACAIILHYRATGTVRNCVNLARATPATHLLVVRHLDRVGVLARVLDALRRARINVEQMENIVFHRPAGGEGAACARIQVVGAPAPELLDAVRADDDIIDLRLVLLEAP